MKPQIRSLVVAGCAVQLALLGAEGWVWYLDRRVPSAVRLDVPHVHDGTEHLCFFGAFAMLALYRDPGLDYPTMLLYGNPTAFRTRPEDLADAARRLGFSIRMESATEDYPGFSGQPIGTWPHRSRLAQVPEGLREKEARLFHWKPLKGDPFSRLRTSISRGEPLVVCVDLAPIYPDLRAVSQAYSDLGHARHFLVVTGYDTRHVYAHDTRKPYPYARHIPFRRDRFLQAWKNTGYACYWLRPEGKRVPLEEVLSGAFEEARRAPRQMLRYARQLESTGLPYDSFEYLTTASSAPRRLAWAAYLERQGMGEAARLYREASRIYPRFDPGMDPLVAAAMFRRIAELERRAAEALAPSPAAAGR